jgi:peptidyl-prolyl cis-trans isomerase D
MLAYVAFGAIIFVFVLWGGSSYMSREANKIAKIDRTVVSMEQYSRAYTDTLKEYQRQYRQAVTPEFIEALNLKQKVLDDLIDQYIIEADAKKMGIVLKDEDLRNFISRVDIFQRNGAFDEGLYRRYLEAEGMTPAQFEDKARKNFLRKVLVSVITENVIVTAEELDAVSHLMNDTYDLNYLVFGPEAFIDSVKVAPEKLRDYFEANKERYRVPARIQLAMVDFPISRYMLQADVSESDARDYYESHKQEFSGPVTVHIRQILIRVPDGSDPGAVARKQELARRVLKEAQAGGDFAALAARYSEDAATAARGGDMGNLPIDALPAQVAMAVQGMKPGEVGGPVAAGDGLYIVRLEEKQKSREIPFEDVSAAVLEKLRAQRARITAHDEAQRAFMEIYEQQKPDMEAYAKARGLPYRMVGPSAERELAAVIRGPEALKKAFSFSGGELGEVVETPEGYAIYKVVRKELSHIPDLKDVSDRVLADVRNGQALELAMEHAQKLAASPKETLQAMNPASTGEFTRAAKAVPKLEKIPKLMDELDGLERPRAFQAGDSVYLVWIRARKTTDVKRLDQKYLAEIRDSLLETKRNLAARDYLELAKDPKKGWHKVTIERGKLAGIGERGHHRDTQAPEGFY